MFPEILHTKYLTIPTYGVLVAAAFLTALWLAGKLAKHQGLNAEAVTNLGIYCALAALGGAKLMMFLVDFRYYAEHPGEIFSFGTLRAGGVFYGGLIAALGVAFWYMRKMKLPPLKTADVFAPAVQGPSGGGTPLLLLKRKVKKMIEEEDRTKPLTDEQITMLLQGAGINVTRRTVAKYREDMKIPSTHQRRVRDN